MESIYEKAVIPVTENAKGSKPHIYVHGRGNYSIRLWACISFGSYGTGMTPALAYTRWVLNVGK